MEKVAIKDSKFVRDIHSKAILNTDRNGLNEYYAKREQLKKEQEEKAEMQNRLGRLEEDMSDIKIMLFKLLELGNKNGS